MTIAEAREKCKSFAASIPRDAFILGVLIFTSTLSFGLGYLTGIDAGQGSSITLEPSPLDAELAGQAPTSEVGAPTGSVGVVASKNGTKYYLPECAGASRISDTNKVWFVSTAAALAAGYTPAANCKGI